MTRIHTHCLRPVRLTLAALALLAAPALHAQGTPATTAPATGATGADSSTIVTPLPPPRGAALLIPAAPTWLPSDGAPRQALARSIRLPDGRPLALGDTLGTLRTQFVRRPDGGWAFTGARLDAPKGAQLVVVLNGARRIVRLQVVYPPKTELASLVAAYDKEFGNGMEMRSVANELFGASWQDGQTALTVQGYKRPNGMFVVTDLSDLTDPSTHR